MFDREAKLAILSRLESSGDPESASAAELILAMDAALQYLADALSCSVSLAQDTRQPCSFRVEREQCVCEQCGQLLSEWELRAAAALECALPDPGPSLPEEDGRPPSSSHPLPSENLAARADKVQSLFRELEDVFGGLALPARKAEIVSTTAPYMRCQGCGTTVSVDVKFCPHCGRTVQGRHCVSCNGLLDRHMNFCPTCGAKAA